MIFRNNLKYLNKTELMCEEKVVESEAQKGENSKLGSKHCF